MYLLLVRIVLVATSIYVVKLDEVLPAELLTFDKTCKLSWHDYSHRIVHSCVISQLVPCTMSRATKCWILAFPKQTWFVDLREFVYVILKSMFGMNQHKCAVGFQN